MNLMTPEQLDGLACALCRRPLGGDVASVPVELPESGTTVYVCAEGCR